MELRQLKYFIQVAERESFSEAAKALRITQSTLSQQIKQLEDELDSSLFIRNSHHVTLTDVGMALLPQAKRTISEADSSIDHIRAIKGVVSGTLNIGTTYTFSPIMSDMVKAFIHEHPGVKINIKCHPVEELIEMLSKQEVDIVFSYRPLDQYTDIESYTLFFNQLSAVMSDTHPYASRTSITIGELSNCKLALPANGMQARSVFNSMIASGSNKFKIQLEVNDINMLLEIVATSHLVTLLSHATIKHGQGLVAIPVDGKLCRMDGCYHIKSGVYQKCAVREFIRILNQTKTHSMRKLDI